jgi:hypothetical protein
MRYLLLLLAFLFLETSVGSLTDRARDYVRVAERLEAKRDGCSAPLHVETEEKWWWKDEGRTLPKHLWVPDTQVKPGVPIEHLQWAGQYTVDKRIDVVVFAMDWWDYPSLSSWDKNLADFRIRNLMGDFNAGRHGWDLFMQPLRDAYEETGYWPDLYAVEGNHDYRIWRVLVDDMRLADIVPVPRDVVEADEVHWYPYLKPVFIDGIGYTHVWNNPMSGRPWGGMMETRLKNIGHSFTMGHQQTYLQGVRYTGDGRIHRGLVAGAFYGHSEDYKGQGNNHWRGIIVKHAVHDGTYNLMEVDIPYLRRRYGGGTILADPEYRSEDFNWKEIIGSIH